MCKCLCEHAAVCACVETLWCVQVSLCKACPFLHWGTFLSPLWGYIDHMRGKNNLVEAGCYMVESRMDRNVEDECFFGEKMNINHRGHQQHHHQHHSITFYHKYYLLEGIPCVCDFFLSEPVTRVQFLTMSKIRLVWVRMSIATCHTVVVLYLATGFLQLSLQCSPRHIAFSCPKQEGRSQKYMQLVAGLLEIFSMR